MTAAAFLVVILISSALIACSGDSASDKTHVEPTQAVRVMPTQQVPTGWKTFTIPGFQVALPENYIGGPTSNNADFARVVADIRRRGGDQAAANYEALRRTAELLMVDPSYGTTVSVVHVGTSSAAEDTKTIAEKINQNQKSAGYEIVEQIVTNLPVADATRTILLVKQPVEYSNLQFVFKTGRDVWIVSYSVLTPEFRRLLAEYDKSAATIHTTNVSR
jgi:hypothetical protein